MIFRISSGVSFYILRTYMIAMLHGRFLLGINVDVSKNSGTPKSSILIGFSIINHPFRGTPIFGGNTHIQCRVAVSWQVLNDDVVLAERGIQHGDQLLCLGAHRRTLPKVLSSITQVVDG